MTIDVEPIGRVESPLLDPASAPKQGSEGAPDAWLVFERGVLEGLDGIEQGDAVIVLTWLDRARRDVLRVHPRDDVANPLRGVFTTRSADRPNPIGLHEVEVAAVEGRRVRVRGLEAVDGTPVVDVKPVLSGGVAVRGAGLAGGDVATRLPAQDLARARRFYAQALGLEPTEERPGGLRYRGAAGEFALFESAGAPSGEHTQMAWEVDDIEATVAQLRRRGVVFEAFDLPGLTTVGGIATVQGNYPSKGGTGERAAWFRDSEGNLLGIGQRI
ncbi:MAG TPA: tRNA (N6-threonylcarbamoyladenosine(37)-N6)-methyltransferase TrmO [Solirubrobacteraceae bacterium]